MCAVNRFDRPIDSQFINTYVPIPFEQMMQAGAMKQQRYDQSAAAMDQSIARAENINAIPNSQDALNRDAALEKIYGIRDKYAGKDLSDSMVIRQLNNEIRSAVKPSDIKKWEDSFAGYQNYKKNEAAMTARGQRIYNPTDFTGYDSSVEGAFSGMPMMDLGAQAEQAINQFMIKPQQDYKTIDLGGGRAGIEHYRDLNKIYARVNNDIGELTSNPAIQQLMERTGMDEGAFKEFLMAKAPDYEEKQLGQTWSTAGTKGSGAIGVPRSFDGVLDLPADVANVSGREARSTGRELAGEVTAKQTTLDNLVKGDASDEEIAAVKADLDNAKERQAEYDSRYNKVSAIIDAEFVDEEKGQTEEYFNKIMNIGGISENKLRQLMGTALDIGGKPGLAQTGQTSFINLIAKEIKDEMPDVPFKIRRQLAAYASEMQPVALAKSRALDVALNQEFSEASTTEAIPLRQQKNTNGYMQFAGTDNRMYDSFIQAQFTGPVKNNPGSFELHADNYSMNNKKDLDKYIRLAALEGTDKDKGYTFDLTSIKGSPNAKGGADLYYTLSGPDIPGDLKSTTVTLSANKPKQIQNVMSDLIMQGSVDAAMTFAYGAFMPQAENEGAGSYNIQYPNVSGEGHPVHQAKAEVTYNNSTDEYDITFAGVKAGSAKNRNELGMAIIELQKWAVQNAEYLSGN